MTLWSELKRRNVLRMAGLYLVAAWLTVQVAGTLLPIFETPPWVLKTLVVLLGLAFVPALVFSWAYELTPEGLKRDSEVPKQASIGARTGRRMDVMIAVGLLAVLGVALANRYWPREAAYSAEGQASVAASAQEEAGITPARARDSIAVLPFVNVSADVENEYFSDGLSEELLNVLGRVDGIGVASRTSSFAYKGRDVATSTIAGELKVGHILEGSVRKSGTHVRITAQLVDALNDRHIWSETYDRELTDIFAIQEEIANAIVSALRGRFGADGSQTSVTVRADTANPQAYDLYLKAREIFIARSDIAESVESFERATELDPNFARGWEGLAAASSIANSWGVFDRDYSALTRRAANRALELDPSLSMPWAAMAMIAQVELPVDWAQNLALMDRAIAADPRNSTAFLWRSMAFTQLGYFDRALADQDRCLALEPGYRNCERWKALTLLFAGETDRAMALFEQGVAAGFVTSRGGSFVAPLLTRGDRTGARLLLKEMGAEPEFSEILIAAFEDRDAPRPDAEAIVRRYVPATSQIAQEIGSARTYLWLGDYERVAGAEDLGNDWNVQWEPGFSGFRDSAAYMKMLERIGVAAYWREHGSPPQCRAASGKNFVCD